MTAATGAATPAARVARALPGYDVGGELGRGGMGVVLGGQHRQLGRSVAIKQLPPQLGDQPAVRSRFVAEAKALAALDHPHIVPIYDFVEDDGLCLLVMEALPGGTVWDRFTTSGLTPAQSCVIAMVTCAALEYAHDHGILHRDIKPENLLFSGDGTLKVTDFGIAKVVGGTDTMATAAGDLIGTPVYMPPEQAEGRDLGPQADVYATGTMLYELLSGALPYSSDGGALAVVFRHIQEDPTPLHEVAPTVPVQLADVVMRAIQRDPAARYATAEDLGVAIGTAATQVWGPGWVERNDMEVRVAGRIIAVTERMTVDDPSAAPDAGPAPVPAANATVGPGQQQVVRSAAATHLPGARPSDLREGELVAVREVIAPPPRPTRPSLAAAGLLLLAVLLAALGLGGGATEPAAGRIEVAGVDPATGAVPVDFGDDIPVRVAELPAGATGTAEARIDFGVFGSLFGASTSARDLEPEGDGFVAELPASSLRFLAAGQMDATLVLTDGSEELESVEFTAEPEGSGVTTVPGVIAIAIAFLVVAYAETFLRPLRRKGRRRTSSLVGMALAGAVLGADLCLLAWALLGSPLTAASMVLAALLAGAAGVLVAIATAQLGRRRRVTRLAAAEQLREQLRAG